MKKTLTLLIIGLLVLGIVFGFPALAHLNIDGYVYSPLPEDQPVQGIAVSLKCTGLQEVSTQTITNSLGYYSFQEDWVLGVRIVNGIVRLVTSWRSGLEGGWNFGNSYEV